jgi:transposase
MGKRQFQLSESEITQLRQQEQQTQRVAEFKRLQAVRLYGSGMTVEQIIDLIGCAESRIRAWAQAYKRDGITALQLHYEHSAQNASKFSEAQRADLQQRLHQYRPDQVLSAEMRVSWGQFWTVPDLQLVVEHWYGVVYDDYGSYRRLLHQCGFSYQRAERVYKSRPSQADIADFEAELEKK